MFAFSSAHDLLTLLLLTFGMRGGSTKSSTYLSMQLGFRMSPAVNTCAGAVRRRAVSK